MIELLQIVGSGTTDLEGEINSFSIRTIGVAVLLLIVLLSLAALLVNRRRFHYLKTPLFIAIAATIVLPSLLLIGSTIYVNTVSESNGPVHWHTDIEFWVCDQEIELRNPIGFFSNKIGTSTYHEHDDKRIHLEGVVVEKDYDASLEKFMDVTGGNITNTTLVIPTEDFVFENDTDGDTNTGNTETIKNFVTEDDQDLYTLQVENGDECAPGQSGEVQVFLFRYNEEDKTYTQKKLDEPARYIMRDESIVPPGDCVIVEFDIFKKSSDKLCKQYGVRDVDRCEAFGVSPYNPELCNLKQVNRASDIPKKLKEIPLLDTDDTPNNKQEEL